MLQASLRYAPPASPGGGVKGRSERQRAQSEKRSPVGEASVSEPTAEPAATVAAPRSGP